MKQSAKKILLTLLTTAIALNPLLSLVKPGIAKADSATDTITNSVTDKTTALINVDNQTAFKYNQQKTYNSSFKSLAESSAYRNLLITMAKFSNSDSFLTFDDLFTSGQAPKLVMNQNDLSALKSLNCLPNILPDFNENFDALYKNLPKDKKTEIDKKVASDGKFKSGADYLSYLKTGNDNDSVDTRLNNSNQFDLLVGAAKKNIGDQKIRQAWTEEISRISKGGSSSVTLDTLVCITGIGREQITDYFANNKTYLADKLKESIDGLTIDVRVLKTLIYLTTPKNQGGAGHWRVRVQRVLQANAQSSESDVAVQTLAKKQVSVECGTDMTASECGKQQGTTADLTVEDKDGTQYDAYLQSLTKAEDSYLSERGLSAHIEGQAVDISEIDDIRCTKVVKKNIGGTKKYKQPVQPIKLAWQTTDGYNASGGSNTFDMMSLLKSAASDSVSGLLSSLNSNISDYDGDLSQASFDDIVQVMGKSLLSNLLDAQSFNIQGFNVEDTLQKLGSVYVADYLGLPREIFLNQNITDLENVKYIIGRAAIEKKLGLPYGSLAGNNLPEILLSIGERKLEHEMNLNAGDLTGFVTSKDEAFALYTGRKILEKELSLSKGSWPKEAKSFSALSINTIKSSLIKNNPGQIDNQLNLGSGTTKNFADGKTDSDDFAKTVGQKRLDDTLYGLKYFSINNAAYQLPGPTKDSPSTPDTWAGALNGEADSLTTIGIYTLARLLAPSALTPETDASYQTIKVTENGVATEIGKDEFGRFVFREWLRGNLLKTGDECNTSASNKSLDFDITNQGQIVLSGSSKIVNSLPSDPIMQSVSYSLVNQKVAGPTVTNNFTISEDNAAAAGFEKIDSQRVFGCATGNSKAVFERIGSTMLYTGVANKLLSKEEKAKIDFTNTNPELRITNTTLAFYTGRITQLRQLTTDIKNNWKTFSKDTPNIDKTGAAINDLLSKLTNIFSDSDSSQAKVVKIQGTIKSLSSKIDSLKGDIETIKNVSAAKQELNSKVQAANTIISDCNELVKVATEIMSGRTLPSSDSLKLGQVSGAELADATNSADTTSTSKSVSPFKASSLIFGLVSGKVSPTELFVRFGANSAEAKLGLPTNSLVYLVQNYERKGIDGVEAFFESIGQAKIESAFLLPAYYFQAKSALASMPDFNSDAKSLAQYADKDKINEAISRYLASKNSVSSSALGSLPADITNVKTDQEIQNVLARMQADQWPDYADLVNSAQTNWKTKQTASIKSLGEKVNVSSVTLQGVIDNIKSRNYNDALKTAEADLLMRLGIGGSYESLKDGGALAWQKAADAASAIDRKLNLKSGSTKALFTNTNLYSTSLSQDEKNLIENNMQVGKNAVDVYTKLLNGDIAMSDLPQYKDQAFNPDYIFENPYADTTSSNGQCPVSFTTKNGFSINETSLQNNTFCYYDNAGRHCFKSSEEAQRYAAANKSQGYGNVLEQLAKKLSELSSQKISADIAKSNLINFINIKDLKYALGADESKNNQIIEAIASNSKVDIEVLRKLFTRQNPKATVNNYLLAAGKLAAQSVLSTKLFKNAGLNVDPSLFGPDDLYKVLNGDLSSLYKVGTNYIDEAMNLKPGTVLSVFNAKDQIARDCNLNQIGGSIIGSLIGLDYFPLKGESLADFLPNLGESKVEQSLNLPRGTFFGGTLNDAITKAKAVNFAIAFKLPISDSDNIIDDSSLTTIFGESYTAKILKTSQAYKLQQVQSYMRSTSVLSSKTLAAIDQINQKVKNLIVAQTATVKSGKANSEFYNNLISIDRLLGVKETSTLDLLAGQNGMTPDSYNKLVGTATGTKLAAAKIGQSLGLDQSQSQATLDLVKNINNIFKCQGSLVKVGGEEVCRNGSGTDAWYHQWGKLYGNLNQIFTLELDEKAGLPEGTFQKIISNPEDAGAVLLGVGAQKIDAQLGLDPSNKLSFTNIYGKLTKSDNQKDCLAEASGDANTQSLDLNLHNAEAALAEVNKQKPAQKQGQNNADYQSSNEYKQWQSDLKPALDKVNQAKTALGSEINNRYNICMASVAKDSTDSGKDALDDIKTAVTEKIHDYIAGMTAKSNGKDVNVGVDMPNKDIDALLNGDMRYFGAAVLSLSVNYVTVTADNIRTNNCGGNDSECQTALPKEMRISYDDIRTSIIGPTDITTYQRAAWVDVNGSYSNPEQTKVCDGANCPKTGSGNFGDTLINSLGQKDSAYSTSDVIAGRVDDQYDFSAANLDTKITSLNRQVTANKQAGADSCKKSTGQSSGSDYDSCIASYSKANGDPEGQLDRLQNPEKYYDPSGANFSAQNSSTADTVRNALKKTGLENLEYKMMDSALWKLDENVYPGMAKDLIKGNAEVKAAALARYIKTGLSNGHLLGIKFTAVENVKEWAQVAGYARDLINGDKNAFSNFASGDGFNFLGDFISDRSSDVFGFKITPDLAKGLLVGIGTGDWGLQSISLDNISKNTSTTHATTLANGKTVNLPTIGGVLTTMIAQKLFGWADKALGLKTGQSYELFKMSYEVYKAWKNYEKIKQAKDVAQLASAKEALASAEGYLVYKLVSIAVDKLLGKQISSVEDSLGMVPGTLTPLVVAAVYNLVVAPLLGVGPVGWVAAAAIAIGGWAFGSKTYYYCTADGYYPEIESAKPLANDTTGLGVWGGRITASSMSDIQAMMQQKSVASAQSKARSLIKNMLWIQKNNKYDSADGEPVVPIQIMTARQEDVDYFDNLNLISSNMCQPRLGESSVSCGGICGSASKSGCKSESRMGIWANKQTTAWTHIGF